MNSTSTQVGKSFVLGRPERILIAQNWAIEHAESGVLPGYACFVLNRVQSIFSAGEFLLWL